MWCDRNKLYGLFFYLFCSELMGIYPVYGFVGKIYLTPLLKQIMCMMCGETVLSWMQWPKRGWSDVPSRHKQRTHMYTSCTLLEQSWDRSRQKGPSSEPFICVPMCHGALCSSGVVKIGSWWADESWIVLGRPRARYYLDSPPCTITSLHFCVYRRAFVA